MSNKELDKLIQLAQQKDVKADELTEVGLTETRRFAIAFDIKEGRKKVPSRCIYTAYKAWADKPQTKATFMRDWAGLFMPQRKASYRYYLLNISAWELDMKVRKMKEHGKE